MSEKLGNRTCNDCKLSIPSGKDNWVKCTKKHNDLKLATAPQCETPYITNGDRIRSMSNEELLQFVSLLPCEVCPMTLLNGCKKGTWDGETLCQQNWLDWLKKEVGDER